MAEYKIQNNSVVRIDTPNEAQEEMVAVSNKPNEITITSLEIAELTGKRHDHILRDIEEQLGKILGDGGLPKFGDTYIHPQNRQSYKIYRLPKREALILVSGYNVELRAKIIDRLEYLENELKKSNAPKLPQNYIEALEALIIKEKERLALEQKLEKVTPLVEFAENIAVSTNSKTIGDFAKILCNNEHIQIGEKRLFAWLRNHGYLQSNNAPYQKFIDCGYFEVKEGSYAVPKGIRTYIQTLITGKGQIYFADKLIKEFGYDTRKTTTAKKLCNFL